MARNKRKCIEDFDSSELLALLSFFMGTYVGILFLLLVFLIF